MKTYSFSFVHSVIVVAGLLFLAGCSKDNPESVPGAESGEQINPNNANCYIVSQSRSFSFPAVKGNTDTSVGTVATVEVLWESFGTDEVPSEGDIVAGVTRVAGIGAPDTIRVTTPDILKNGNAVIAAKDASGEILWSWHIWVCKDFDPVSTAQEYYNNDKKMMDRNLGATSATPGEVGALGLLYQWGRKDPFLGSSQISYESWNNQTKAASTLSWPPSVSSDSSTGTIEYAVKNPTTFIKIKDNSVNYDWYYTGDSNTDNTRWQSSKTIYDPCPPGWRIPDGGSNGVWSTALGKSDDFVGYPFDDTKKGMNFSGTFGDASTIWYPAAGYLSSGVGSLLNAGFRGFWWSCVPNRFAYCLRLYSAGVSTQDYEFRSRGLSVRCLQE